MESNPQNLTKSSPTPSPSTEPPSPPTGNEKTVPQPTAPEIVAPSTEPAKITENPQDDLVAKVTRLEKIVLGTVLETQLKTLPENFNKSSLEGLDTESQLDFIRRYKLANPIEEKTKSSNVKPAAQIPAQKTMGATPRFDVAARSQEFIKNYKPR